MTKTKPRYTRKQVPDYIEDKYGFRPSSSVIEKLGMLGRFAPDSYYGRAALYRPETIDKLANELISERPVDLGLPRYEKSNSNEAP
jgi:hypothetical protein